MKNSLASILIIIATTLCSPSINATGFKQLQVQDAGEADITVGVWYPSDTPAPANVNTQFGMALALNAAVGNTNGGLILISHGYSGWYAGHADTAVALAEAGYIVAAPTHTGNTWSDMSSPVAQWVLDRPRHISRVIDHLLIHDALSEHIVQAKIGVYGFSAGGYTAVGLVGGVPDLTRAQLHCRNNPKEFACSEGLINAMTDANMDELPASAWGADDRIQAAAISAPGWAFAYSKSALSQVSADIQLWSGMLDDRVPTNTNAAILAMHLPKKPETHWIEKANHFAFLTMPCRDEFKREDPEEYQVVCGDAPGFDRRAFHADMHIEMIRFFNEKLNIVK